MAAYGRHSSGVEELEKVTGFRGQRGGKRNAVRTRDLEVIEGLSNTKAPEECFHEEQTAEVLAQKGLSVNQLIAFHKRFTDSGKLSTDPALTCWQVLQDVIIPVTAEHKCCYVNFALGEKGPPQCFVSHWFGLPFQDLFCAVVAHACGGLLNREMAEKKAIGGNFLPDEVRERSYWICMFATNFHQLVGTGHPLNDLATLECVMSNNKTVLVVVDQQLETLSRTWCCLELFQAAQQEKEVIFDGTVDERFTGGEGVESCYVGLRASTGFDATAVDTVQGLVQSRVGFEAFDQKTKGLFVHGVYSVLWRALMKPGSCKARLDMVRSLLDRGLDVETGIRMGEPALLWAVQYSQSSLVALLLEHGASSSFTTTGGWTPLHQAAQLGAEASVAALLAARADVNAVSQVGRTALMEAAERGHPRICELLLDAGADVDTADSEGHKASVFHGALESEELCARLGWRSKSALSPSPPPEPA